MDRRDLRRVGSPVAPLPSGPVPVSDRDSGAAPNARSDAGPVDSSPSSVRLAALVECVAAAYPISFVAALAPPDGRRQLFAASADGARVRRLVAEGNVHGPVWSRDGLSIAFERWPPPSQPSQDYPRIELMALPGKERTELSPIDVKIDAVPSLALTAPTWSPDDEALAFASGVGAEHLRVWLMSRTGGQRRLLLPDFELPHYLPSWSRHDADLLAVVGELADGTPELWLVRVGEPEPVAALNAGRLSSIGRVRWSPDGRWLALDGIDARSDAGGLDREIFILDLDSLELSAVTDNDVLDLHPAWSPDGQSLVFSSAIGLPVGAGMNLWRVTLKAPRAFTQITDSAGTDLWPDWHAGGGCGRSP